MRLCTVSERRHVQGSDRIALVRLSAGIPGPQLRVQHQRLFLESVPQRRRLSRPGQRLLLFLPARHPRHPLRDQRQRMLRRYIHFIQFHFIYFNFFQFFLNLFQFISISFHFIQFISISFHFIQFISIFFNFFQFHSIYFHFIQFISIYFNSMFLNSRNNQIRGKKNREKKFNELDHLKTKKKKFKIKNLTNKTK